MKPATRTVLLASLSLTVGAVAQPASEATAPTIRPSDECELLPPSRGAFVEGVSIPTDDIVDRRTPRGLFTVEIPVRKPGELRAAAKSSRFLLTRESECEKACREARRIDYGWAAPSQIVPIGWGTPYWAYFPQSHVTFGSTFYTPDPLRTDPSLTSAYTPPAPASEPVEVPPSPTLVETALQLMHQARYSDAAKAYQLQLQSQPDDFETMRCLGLSLLLSGQTREGMRALGRAYTNDPSLAGDRFDARELAIKPAQLQKLSAPVAAVTRRERSADGFIAAAVLWQLRGRPDLATKALDEAKSFGLDAEVHARLTAHMTPAPKPPPERPLAPRSLSRD